MSERVDYFYEEIRPYIVIDRCKYKHVVSDEKRNGHICYEKQDCFNCGYCHAMQCICKLKLEEHTSDIYRMWEDKCERWEMRVN